MSVAVGVTVTVVMMGIAMLLVATGVVVRLGMGLIHQGNLMGRPLLHYHAIGSRNVARRPQGGS
jgi:hypothetical protein